MNKTIKKILITASIIAVSIPATFFIYKAYMLKQAEKEVGTIDINAMVYENADAGLTDIHPLKISRMYYMKNMILEEIDDNGTLKYSLFNNKFYTPYTSDLDSIDYLQGKDIEFKNIGAVPLGDSIPNYENRVLMNDTILDDISYRRFAVRNPNEYTVFYVQDNLKIPYSFNRVAEHDYKGTISRIDSYKIREDVFISITLKTEKKIQKTYFNKLSNHYFKFGFL